jgi:hypothetical protein
MRFTLFAVPLALTGSVLAFPTMGNGPRDSAAGCPFAANAAKLKRQSNTTLLATFDPTKQKVDVSGKYAFQPPKAGDKRVGSLSTHVSII